MGRSKLLQGLLVCKMDEKIIINEVEPVFSIRKLAEYLDFHKSDGKPATDSVLELWHSGRIPPPDFRITRKAVYWKVQTIKNFIENGGNYVD